MNETTPTWGYKPDGSAEIFDLAPGETLPDGWHGSPDCIADPTLATAEALTARADGRPSPAALDLLDETSDRPVAVLDADLTNALAEIARLSTIIATGTSENEKLVDEIEAVEAARDAALAEVETARAAHADTLAALDAAGTALTDLQAQLTQAQADGGFAVAERDAANADLERLRADLAQARADLDAATAPAPAAPKATKAR
jgi:chromosome segregation ATPase